MVLKLFVDEIKVDDVLVQDVLDVKVVAPAHSSFDGGGGGGG